MGWEKERTMKIEIDIADEALVNLRAEAEERSVSVDDVVAEAFASAQPKRWPEADLARMRDRVRQTDAAEAYLNLTEDEVGLWVQILRERLVRTRSARQASCVSGVFAEADLPC